MEKPQRGGRRAGAGRKVSRATVYAGDGVRIFQVSADGSADLGRGIVRIDRSGTTRRILITQDDGSEIRISLYRQAAAE